MSQLSFLSPDRCDPDVRLASPLARALAGARGGPIRDVSALGSLEVRGDLDAAGLEPGEELVRITPERGLLLTEGSPASARERVRAGGLRVYDLTGALAALEIDGNDLMRRLTDLDLDALPAVGAVARGVWALVQPVGRETFRVLVPQELGHYVAEVALDLAEGLRK